jgi:hypothetical protein
MVKINLAQERLELNFGRTESRTKENMKSKMNGKTVK